MAFLFPEPSLPAAEMVHLNYDWTAPSGCLFILFTNICTPDGCQRCGQHFLLEFLSSLILGAASFKSMC